jgi:hypothetical protein
MNEALKAELDKPLNGIDRLRMWLADPETFDPISPEDAEEILAKIDLLESLLPSSPEAAAYGGGFNPYNP